MTALQLYSSKDEAPSRLKGTPDRDAERHLVGLAVEGDSEAFASLYDLHVVRVYRHVYYLVNRQADAEDLTAQTFLKAWQAIPRYKETGAPFVAWLLRISHNLTVSFLRAKRDHSDLDEGFVDSNRGGNPEQTLMHSEDEASVRAAVLQLRGEQQQVIMLRFVEELEYTEVAAIVGKSVPAVRVIQHRALANLKKIMQAS